jgi:hypothetical protein
MSNITYTQKIFAVDTTDTQDFEQVVVRVHWEQRAKQDTHFAVANRVTELSKPDAESFVNFDQLTEQQVMQWVQQDPLFEQQQQEITEQLSAQQSDTINRAPPWEDVNDTVFSRSYLVTIDGKVVWGPNTWNTFSINQALWQNGIYKSIPNLVAAIPETEPLVVGDASVYRARLDIDPPQDPVVHDISEVIWDFSSGIAVPTQTATVKSLEDLKQSVISWIVSVRMSTPHQNVLQSQQYAQRTDMLLLASTTQSGQSVQIMDSEHNPITITHEQIMQQLEDMSRAHLDTQSELANLIHSVRTAQTVQEVTDIYESLNSQTQDVPDVVED